MFKNSHVMKASFKSLESRSDYEGKRCILLISVGQKYHEENYLGSTIDLINKSGFKACLIAVADTLQRHNYPGVTPDNARLDAEASGSRWLKRNAACINTLIPETRILRWDEALQHPHYESFHAHLLQEYQKNSILRAAYKETIQVFIDRFKKRTPDLDDEMIFTNSLNYLIEECPMLPLCAFRGYDYVIYPKPMTVAMHTTWEIFVKSCFPDKGNWLSLRFKKLAQYGSLHASRKVLA